MRRYYYFAATLPAPQMGSPPPLSSADYLARCALHLAAADLAVLRAASLVSPAEGQPAATVSSPLLTRYYAWERTLRNELVRLRARRLERDGESMIRPTLADDTAARSAAAIFAAGSPLEAELLLERERWGLIRSLSALHVFDLERLLSYRLELQILERLGRLRQTEGEARYRETYAAIMGAAESTKTGVQR